MAPYDTIVGIGIVFVCTKAFINTICMVLLGIVAPCYVFTTIVL